jgi:hypothetical protein
MHVSALIVAVVTGCRAPGLKTTNQITAHNTFEETEKMKNIVVCYTACSTIQDTISQQMLFQVVAASLSL